MSDGSDPLVLVTRRDAFGYPEHLDAPDMGYVPLSGALTEPALWDAHTVQYSLPSIPKRLAGDRALPLGPSMVLVCFDVDCPGHGQAQDDWYAREWVKVTNLLVDHPGAFVYRTRGGYRVVYRIVPIVLRTIADKKCWSATYADAVAYIGEQFEIICDSRCADWTHLFRLPHVTRDGIPTDPGPVIGDPAAIGMWDWTWDPSQEALESSPIHAPEIPAFSGAPTPQDYQTAVQTLAEAWPSRGRHQAQLALAGALSRAGWPVELVAQFAHDVAEAHDPGSGNLEKRLAAARSSADKLRAGDAVVGWPTLEEHVGPQTVAAATRALGMGLPAADPDFLKAITATARPRSRDVSDVPVLPSRLEVRNALETARDRLKKAKGLDAKLDAKLLARVLKGDYLTERADEDRALALVRASLAVVRAMPTGTPPTMIVELLLSPAGPLGPDVAETVDDAIAFVQKEAADAAARLDVGDLTEPADDDELRDQLDLLEDGRVRGTGNNVERIIRFSSALRDQIRFNLLTKQIEVAGGRFARETLGGLPVGIKNWLSSHWQLTTSTTEVQEQVLRVAMTWNSYDPVAEYLNGLTWDGKIRLGSGSRISWLTTYCNVEDSGYVRKVGARFMISAVARALDPGCKVDTILVLEGDQGLKKSSCIGILGGEWFTDTPMMLNDKDSRLLAGSKWIVEWGELRSLIQDDEAAKGFLAQRNDDIRPPYGRATERFPRRCVFMGSTNQKEYLQDESGNRRYWAVRTGVCEMETLMADRDQLWAEAVYRYKHADLHPDQAHFACPGERWWFEPVEQAEADLAVADRLIEDPWIHMIDSWIAGQVRQLGTRAGKTVFAMSEIMEHALKISSTEMQRHKRRVSQVVRAAGLEPVPEHERPVDELGRRQPKMWRRAGMVVHSVTTQEPREQPVEAIPQSN